MTRAQRTALIVATALVLGGAFVLASGGDDDNGTTTTTTAAPATATTATTSPTATTPATTTTTTTTTPSKPATPVIRVVDGEPEGGVEQLEFAKGDQIRFAVRSDVADEIHVHGYDVAKDVPAGGSVSFAFRASIDGIFEIELENAGVQIAELKVSP